MTASKLSINLLDQLGNCMEFVLLMQVCSVVIGILGDCLSSTRNSVLERILETRL